MPVPPLERLMTGEIGTSCNIYIYIYTVFIYIYRLLVWNFHWNVDVTAEKR